MCACTCTWSYTMIYKEAPQKTLIMITSARMGELHPLQTPKSSGVRQARSPQPRHSSNNTSRRLMRASR